MPKKIAIIGAGPKAAAIAARAAALRAVVGDPATVPDLVIFEKDAIGAAWSGHGNFSSGFLELCTPGEKDVGFPYHEAEIRRGEKRALGREIFGRFSWQAYCVANDRYAEWIDRGRRHPTHAQWSNYLGWVFAEADLDPVIASVAAVRPKAGRWQVEYVEAGKVKLMAVDAVVVTGTGTPRRVPHGPGVPPDRLLDAESFWPNRDSLKLGPDSTIAVVGDGGGAGAIIGWLCDRYAERDDVAIRSICPAGTLFPRGDGYAERRWFSDPSEWADLAMHDRENILKRTEAGVVSSRNKERIDRSPNLGFVRGHAVSAAWDGDELSIAINYNRDPAPPVRADYLVSAIGFESWDILRIVDDPGVHALLDPSGRATRERARAEFLPNLEMPPVAGLPAGLHVPALADLAQGPGMGNLGCLGLMAAAILDHYRT